MTTPNRIKIIFDGGVAEIYGDMMHDMLTCWYNQLYERQKDAQAEVAAIQLRSDFRMEEFKAGCFNYDDAESRMKICGAIERVFKNRSGEPKTYIQEGPQ
jgi:hypothetical protein